MSEKYITTANRNAIKKWATKLKKEEILSYPKKKALKKLKLPYKCIGAGKHRIVFDMGKGYILKVARVTKGIKCNSREVRLYHRVPPSLRKHLGKIVDHGDGWLIMKKINKHLPKTRDFKKRVSNVYRKFKSYGVKISDIVKSGRPNKNNIRVNKKRRVVLIDYANNRKR